MIDYAAVARAVRGVVELAVPEPGEYIDASELEAIRVEQLRLLQQFEDDHAAALVRDGVNPEVARLSAISFMSQVLETLDDQPRH